MNRQIAESIQDGSLSGSGLDAQIVKMEQTKVQEALDNLKQSDPKAYSKLIKEANAALNPTGSARKDATQFASDEAYVQILNEVRNDLGRDIDFANQADREAIGNKLIKHIRETRGCAVTGDKAKGC